jgi:hypothetical protein
VLSTRYGGSPENAHTGLLMFLQRYFGSTFKYMYTINRVNKLAFLFYPDN